MNIYIIGYRGTGKTHVGNELAKALGKEFIDTDDLIVERAGKKIPEIFGQDGEEKFRDIESAVLSEIAARDGLVVGCGGGIILREDNIEKLKKSGVVILLEAPPEKIYARIRGDSNRPALTDKDEFEEIRHVLAERKGNYEKAADHRVDAGNFSIRENVGQIIEILKKEKAIE
ncbi:MAG: shikimate kinase [Candidatus Diapherotrites archaeon]